MSEKPEVEEHGSSRDAEIPEKSVEAEVIPGTGITEEDIRSGSVVPEQILKHSHDADVALQAFQSYEGQVIEVDEATNRRLLRIIDWNLIPLMCVVYGLNYLDKTTLSYASIMGIKDPPSKGGIGLVGSQYNWLGSMFYFVRPDLLALRSDIDYIRDTLAGNGRPTVFFNTSLSANTPHSTSSCGEPRSPASRQSRTSPALLPSVSSSACSNPP